jgi:DNA (cytosine-5)-methyltransferase 1
MKLAQASRADLRAMSYEQFWCGWHALLFLLPDVHPHSALDHGVALNITEVSWPSCGHADRLISRRYARSGWPVALSNVGSEAWRRFRHGEISDGQFFCVEAQIAGMRSVLSAAGNKREAAAA